MRKKYRGVRGAMDADANFDLELSQPTNNPLHAAKPSSAYLQSQKRARDESSPSNLDRNPVNHHVKPGWRTILSAAILFLGGLTLLILGTVVYVDSSKGGSVVSKDQGQDLLIVGAVSKSLHYLISISIYNFVDQHVTPCNMIHVTSNFLF